MLSIEVQWTIGKFLRITARKPPSGFLINLRSNLNFLGLELHVTFKTCPLSHDQVVVNPSRAKNARQSTTDRADKRRTSSLSHTLLPLQRIPVHSLCYL